MTSPIALVDGTGFPWPVYGSGTSLRDTDCSTQIAAALRAGFRHIDCAEMYRNAAAVGAGIAQSGVPRGELYVTTKLLPVPAGATAADSLRGALRTMQLGHVDLCLVHEPVGHRDLAETWRQMEACRTLGLTKSIGVSNFRVRDLEEIRQGGASVPVVNQIEVHPYVYEASLPVLQYMREHHILPVAFSGLAPLWRVQGGPLNPILDAIASRMRDTTGGAVTRAQVLQLWLRKKGIPYTTTTSTPDRLYEYLAVAQLPDLDDDDEQQIDAAGRTAHHRFFCKYIDEP
ncbi:hypothetical protein PHLGIDRAFT_327351 [Phlebiopsis gigantea 11061_1 CR5-6]|uniref:NADP-dependent oxidoreductase domain-containing protein n=1 Tax=Phlebiopsis gigantea (strain 11061_1 CR5-6) TaxID=745531 RepID=A0A0C3PW84_PHLG1|nr:hypothetical protein PHLGIDRAFT_327351 [Phlebiopsis gigantea 11061_1 CR5-6]